MSGNNTATPRQRTPDQLSRPEDKYVVNRLQKVSRQFHSCGEIGEAFQTLVKAGCHPNWLEQKILCLARYPLYGRRTRYGYAERRRLKRTISKMRSVAEDLGQMRALFVLMTFRARNWPIDRDIPQLFEQVADWLQVSESTVDPREISLFTASDRIPYLIDQVAHLTGRPHYPEMATLIGAAYGEPNFSEGQLKMFVRRAKATAKRPPRSAE